MARPQKEGLDYFPHDVYAASDEKIETLVMLYGAKGYAFYFMHLEYIYRKDSLSFQVSDAETRQIICNKLQILPEEYEKILQTALKYGCFDKEHYDETGELTSNGVKKRAEPVFEKRQKMAERYRDRKTGKVSAAETQKKPDKVKESKEKERKELEDTSLRSVSSCPEPSAKASEPQQAEQKAKPGNHDQPDLAILTFPLAKKGETFPVTQSDIDEWGESFPGIDLLQELRHCLQWSRDNPTRRKTKNGIRKHITAWLGKAQDRTRGQPQAGHAGPGGYPAPRTVKDAITIQQDMEAKRLLEKKLRERGLKNGNGNAGDGAGCGDDAEHTIGQGTVQRQRVLAGPGIH